MEPLFPTYINGATYVKGNWDPCIDSRKSEHTYSFVSAVLILDMLSPTGSLTMCLCEV